MAQSRSKVPQRYFAAAQELLDNGRIRLTLLEETKDTAACHVLIRSQDFVNLHADMNIPIRVCILRDEPALRLIRKPNELADKIREVAGDRADQVLKVLVEGAVSITGDVDFELVQAVGMLKPSSEGVQEGPPEAPDPPPIPVAPAPPEASTQQPPPPEGPPPTAPPPTPPPEPPAAPPLQAPPPPAPAAAPPSVAAPPPPEQQPQPAPPGPPGPPAPPPPPPPVPEQGQGAVAPPPLGPPPPAPQGGLVKENGGRSGQADSVPVGNGFGVPPIGGPPPPPGPPTG